MSEIVVTQLFTLDPYPSIEQQLLPLPSINERMAPITKYLFPILVLLLPFTTGVTTCYRNLKNPIPAGARCGTYGTLTTPKVLREATRLLATENNCRDECMNDVACTAFSVNANTKRCRIYSGTLASMGFKTGPSSGGVRFWEVRILAGVVYVCLEPALTVHRSGLAMPLTAIPGTSAATT